VKTFLRKLKLSLRAMLCGWIACNVALWLAWLSDLREHLNGQQIVMTTLWYGFATGMVILVAWLAIFLPVDLLVPDHSILRKPRIASICGFFAGSSVIVFMILREGVSSSRAQPFHWATFIQQALLLSSPGITGMVAAYVRSRDDDSSL
jgi:hypothetical protein